MEFLTEVNWASFLLAMVVIELTPGPNMGWLAALSAQTGRRPGLMAVTGITLGLSVQVVAAATGLAAIAGRSEVIYHALRWAGVLYMLWLAWLAWAETSDGSAHHVTYRGAFRRGLISNLLNPKALVFYMVVVGQFVRPAMGDTWTQILILGGIHVLIAAAVHSAIVLMGARLGEALDTWRTSVPVRLFFALSLAGIALWIALTTGEWEAL